MSECPYPETFVDPVSSKTEPNSLHSVWHEGYESHKLEVMAKSKYIDVYMRELCAEVK